MKKYFGYLSIFLGLLFLATIYFDKWNIPFFISLILTLSGILFGILGVKYTKLSAYIGVAVNLGGIFYILSTILALG